MYSDHCTDEYDTVGAATLQALCTAQSGTWSTTPCIPATWSKKCTQEPEESDGVYIQYLRANGQCVGCEEQLARGDGGTSGIDVRTGAACTPESPEGHPYIGSCTHANYCEDKYDYSFGVDAYIQWCQDGAGTFSTTPCAPSSWDEKCTQDFVGEITVWYLRAGATISPDLNVCLSGCKQEL
jgi:hypothetical protein